MPAAVRHPSFQPRPGAMPPAALSALPQPGTTAYSAAQHVEGVTRDLRRPAAAPAPIASPAPARRVEPEWLRPAGERRISDTAIVRSDDALLPERRSEVARLSERATGRDLVRRPVTETSVLPASGYGGGDSGGGDYDDYDDYPPFDRGGRHRGPRRPAFRAAVPIVAVLAAGGGAFGLVHAVSTGAPGSQTMDMASGNNSSAITTDLSNAPSAVDGSGSSTTPGTDSRTSPLDASASTTAGPFSTTNPGQHTTSPLGNSTIPGAPGTTSTSAPAGPGTPGSSGSGLPSSQPVQTSNPSSAPGTPSTPPSSTGTPSNPGTPSATPTTPSQGPTSPTTPSQGPTSPGTPTTTPTSGQTPPSGSSPSTPPSTPSTPPTTPSASGTTPQLPTTGTLQPGDTGSEVSTLQTLLDRIGGSTWVPVTGVYDTRTADAVAYVQKTHTITADPAGVCGPTTAAAINALAAQ